MDQLGSNLADQTTQSLVPGCPRCDIGAMGGRMVRAVYRQLTRLVVAVLVGVPALVVLLLLVSRRTVLLWAAVYLLVVVGGTVVFLWRARLRRSQVRAMIRAALIDTPRQDVYRIRHNHALTGPEPVCPGCIADLLGEPSLAEHAHAVAGG
ncbi:hypothetical protein M6D93_19115 [Jatrophihabitans telluris]|uniref:Integral membrane protein n=1 Tax=Jatrophihabitans telluris TaxID=2038343 RepID=A0ABY4QXJ7_9ACTN|nr:hypothetical protein [Jatrophihabitans telluris]UQX88368.1 hypothetical protein M6D93_19115 [Jatrophihabitans telluris]